MIIYNAIFTNVTYIGAPSNFHRMKLDYLEEINVYLITYSKRFSLKKSRTFPPKSSQQCQSARLSGAKNKGTQTLLAIFHNPQLSSSSTPIRF
jgi:hypothetical protein